MGLGTYFERSEKDAPSSVLHRSQPWYEAYMESLFEYDPARVAAKIQRAQDLIQARRRELLAGASNEPERRALREALQALQALQTRIEH